MYELTDLCQVSVIRAAVIGAGYLGKFHAEKYARSEHAQLEAVVDVRAAIANEIARKHRTRALTDYAALAELDIDCVSIASDTATHFEVAKWCLCNGIDVLVEKPMTVDVQQALELINLARQYNRILQVGHLRDSTPHFARCVKCCTTPGFSRYGV